MCGFESRGGRFLAPRATSAPAPLPTLLLPRLSPHASRSSESFERPDGYLIRVSSDGLLTSEFYFFVPWSNWSRRALLVRPFSRAVGNEPAGQTQA